MQPAALGSETPRIRYNDYVVGGNATRGPRAEDCRGGGWVKHYTVQRRPPTAGQKFRKNGKYGATQAVRCGVFTDAFGGAYIYVYEFNVVKASAACCA